MAILKDNDGNQYEVRIKRYPDGTYFDEHIKTEERDKPDAGKCTRYVISEAGMRYTIELTLRKGFSFDTYDRVQAQLYFPGSTDSVAYLDIFRPESYAGLITEDIRKELEYADVTIRGRKMQGTRFAFRSLVADENLDASTDVVGIDPQSLGRFEVRMFKLKWDVRTLTESEHAEKVAKAERAQSQSQSDDSVKKLWDAQKVDEDSFSKDGITCAVGFVGGRPQSSFGRQRFAWSRTSADVPRIEEVSTQGKRKSFNFHYRSAEFVEQTGIVKYPPPLYLYPWKDLTETEQKAALKELQAINKDHVHRALETKSGGVVQKHGKGRKIDEPKEWRAWSKMYGWERELTFNTLKKAKRANERGEVQRQFESNGGEIISLIDDEPEEDTRPKPKKRMVAVVEDDDSDEDELSESEVNKAVNGESKVKNEPIDIDAPPVKKSKVKQNAAPVTSDSDDEELKKKREKARKLAKDIETEERLARMKREQRALEAEIEAAEKKKRGRK